MRATEVFSPNRDGRFDRMHMSFFLKRTDDVTATVLNRAGDEIRVLAERRLRAGQRMRAGVGRHRRREAAPVPDGIYRIRLNLRRQGRAVLIPRNIDKDTTPPQDRRHVDRPGAQGRRARSCCRAPTASRPR